MGKFWCRLKVLGLNCNNMKDTLSLNFNSLLSEFDEICTKGNVLHKTVRIFDLSELISPFLIQIKCLLQELWQLSLEWDKKISEEFKQNQLKWWRKIKEINKLEIPRYYFSISVSKEKTQLRCFLRSFIKIFWSCGMFQISNIFGHFNTKFIISKTRLAQLKKLMLPYLELMGTIIAARTVKHLRELFKNLEKITMQSDSTIVLHWIRG